MGFEDRDYYRDRPSSGNGVIDWLLFGQIKLFRAFGIRVAAHSSMIIYIGLTLVFGIQPGFTVQDRLIGMGALFLIVLLHEFGHCFAARWVGGSAENIVMHPLGGLALRAPHRPLPTFITVAGGPMVNVIICVISGAILWTLSGWLPWDPFSFRRPIQGFEGWLNVWSYAYWIYQMSFSLLVFNLLPIFPLDGGQMLQTILWPRIGYYKSMYFSATVGLVAAILAGGYALVGGAPMLLGLALFGGLACYQIRKQLRQGGAAAFGSEEDRIVGASLEQSRSALKTEEAKRRKQLEKLRAEEAAEQVKVDQILAKVSAQGMHSLNWLEKRTLKRATENQRRRQMEMNRRR